MHLIAVRAALFAAYTMRDLLLIQPLSNHPPHTPQAALQPVEGPLRSALGALGGVLSGLPDLRLPIKQVRPGTVLLGGVGCHPPLDCQLLCQLTSPQRHESNGWNRAAINGLHLLPACPSKQVSPSSWLLNTYLGEARRAGCTADAGGMEKPA